MQNRKSFDESSENLKSKNVRQTLNYVAEQISKQQSDLNSREQSTKQTHSPNRDKS